MRRRSISGHHSHAHSHPASIWHSQFSYSECFYRWEETREHVKLRTDSNTSSRLNQQPWSWEGTRLPAVPLCSLSIQNNLTSFLVFPCLGLNGRLQIHQGSESTDLLKRLKHMTPITLDSIDHYSRGSHPPFLSVLDCSKPCHILHKAMQNTILDHVNQTLVYVLHKAHIIGDTQAANTLP